MAVMSERRGPFACARTARELGRWGALREAMVVASPEPSSSAFDCGSLSDGA
jgi:hypothetical protein